MLRAYADTSLFGGVFEAGREQSSLRFFDRVRFGEFRLVTSGLVVYELTTSPTAVLEFFNNILELAEVLQDEVDALALMDAYLKAGIVTPKWRADALHVAHASVSKCTMIVSWNFKHIVNHDLPPENSTRRDVGI